MKAGDRVQRRGLDGLVDGPPGEVIKVFAGLARGIVRVRWFEHGDPDGRARTTLESTASLEVIE